MNNQARQSKMLTTSAVITPSLTAFIQSLVIATLFVIVPIANALIMVSFLDRITRSVILDLNSFRTKAVLKIKKCVLCLFSRYTH